MAQFEWDSAKDKANQDKHGMPFAEAQFAFADPHRVIARDLEHSHNEERFYCFGLVKGGVACSRFDSLIETKSSASSAPAIGARAKRSMSNSKIRYTHEPIRAEVISDFLPAPEDLAFKEEDVKVTLALSKKSVDFFKSEAQKHHAQYQRMIRKLLDAYVDSRGALTSGSSRRSRLRRARG